MPLANRLRFRPGLPPPAGDAPRLPPAPAPFATPLLLAARFRGAFRLGASAAPQLALRDAVSCPRQGIERATPPGATTAD